MMTARVCCLMRGFAGLGLATVLGACSLATSGLSTGSLLAGAKSTEDPATARVLQVAATSARASRCGYNFDQARLRTAYLAYESTQAGGAEQLARLEKAYDFTLGSVAGKMGPAAEYCTDDQTARIKSDLTRHLAGDYTPAPKRAEASFLDTWGSSSDNKKFDPNVVFGDKSTR